MQLLPALLVLRGTPSAGATQLLPSDEDLLAIERSSGDPLVRPILLIRRQTSDNNQYSYEHHVYSKINR